MRDVSELWAARLIRIAFVILCVRLFPHAGVVLADLSSVDTSGYVWDFIHHGVQLVLGLGIMLLFSRSFSLRDIGFNLNHWRWSLKVTARFAVGWTIAMILVVLLTDTASMTNPTSGDLLFAWTLNGLSEEVLFRAFIIGMLYPVFPKMYPIFGKNISAAGIFSVVLFALASVSISFVPFSITCIDPMQQLSVLGLGLFFVIMFEHTHSLLGPVLAHNLSRGILLMILFIMHHLGT